ncbi:pilus assembly protein TadG-related protein [Planococcus sp. APC 4015]|nr:pilus assembly protein TadG-related protein [Planococcus sp. APC 4015]
MIRRLVGRLRTEPRGDDVGSVMLLTIGYAMLAIVTVLVCVDATSLYVQQKRLDSLADAAALAGADAFSLELVDGQPTAALRPADVRAGALALLAAVATDAVLVEAEAPDGRSARVTVAGTWHPPVFTLFVPAGVALEATATSRTALR